MAGLLTGWYEHTQEGLVALWRGWVPSVIGVIPYVGLNFAVYETLKDGVIQVSGDQAWVQTLETECMQCQVISVMATAHILFKIRMKRSISLAFFLSACSRTLSLQKKI